VGSRFAVTAAVAVEGITDSDCDNNKLVVADDEDDVVVVLSLAGFFPTVVVEDAGASGLAALLAVAAEAASAAVLLFPRIGVVLEEDILYYYTSDHPLYMRSIKMEGMIGTVHDNTVMLCLYLSSSEISMVVWSFSSRRCTPHHFYGLEH
jgi:hypothetical protein